MKRRVVLCGAGHTHLHVASHASSFKERETELVVIAPRTFWYSGMATGLLGGRYTREQDCVDVGHLVQSCGGLHIPDRVIRIDPQQHILRTGEGREIEYDFLSMNIGSSVAPVPAGSESSNVWPVKPISRLLDLHRRLKTSLESNQEAPRCLVLGGGSTGCEAAGNLAALFEAHSVKPRVHLTSSDQRLCQHLPERASRSIEQTLRNRGVEFSFGERVSEIQEHAAHCESGSSFPFHHLVLATGLAANRIEMYPETRQSSGYEVDGTLLSTVYPDLFASGDCAEMRGYRLPKIGVFGVRQAPVLLHNLLASLDCRPMQTYSPQKHYLSILNLGDSTGLAVRDRLWWHGRSSMWLKEWLDRRFIRHYQSIAVSPPSADDTALP